MGATDKFRRREPLIPVVAAKAGTRQSPRRLDKLL
jgi:hypothetical protein